MKSILDLLPVKPDVRQITIDFEKALWSVLRQVLPGVKIKGCVFHWTQALWRKVGSNISFDYLNTNFELIKFRDLC